MSTDRKKILIVDDDENIRTTMSCVLEAKGFDVDTAETGGEAMEKGSKSFYNLALFDIRLPDMEGTDLLKNFKRVSPTTIKIMLTGYPQVENAIKAVNNGADAYFTKPADIDKLLKTIEEKLNDQKNDERKTEDEFGLLLKKRAEKLKSQLR